MLVEECFYLAFVGVAESFGTDGDFVAVLIGALLGEGVDVVEGGKREGVQAEGGEGGRRDWATGVVGGASGGVVC